MHALFFLLGAALASIAMLLVVFRQRSRQDRRLESLEAKRETAEHELTRLQEQLNSRQAQLVEQKRLLEEAETKLKDAFRSVGAEALQANNEQFLHLAKKAFEGLMNEARGEGEQRQKAIQHLLEPVKETLSKLESRTGEIEKARVDAYSRIDEQVKALAESTHTLQERAQILATALRGSQARGRWGEIALRNVVELAGMTKHVDFNEQETTSGGKRPDMTVRLPDGRFIAIDAKVPLTAYLEAHEATDPDKRQRALASHAKALHEHIRTLSGRDYAAEVEGDVDLVVLFLPGDPILAAAFEQDPELQERALRARVLIATPTTLVALLRTVAVYWQQRAMADNAEAIASTARELYDRAAKFGDELGGVGRGLKSALDAYNRAVGSFDRRFMPMGRKLEEMKVAEQSRRALEAPDPIDETPRESDS